VAVMVVAVMVVVTVPMVVLVRLMLVRVMLVRVVLVRVVLVRTTLVRHRRIRERRIRKAMERWPAVSLRHPVQRERDHNWSGKYRRGGLLHERTTLEAQLLDPIVAHRTLAPFTARQLYPAAGDATETRLEKQPQNHGRG
jgi:hypothetical protein